MLFYLWITLRIVLCVIICIIKLDKEHDMNDTTDLTTLSIRIVIFLVIAGIFYFTLKSKKKDK